MKPTEENVNSLVALFHKDNPKVQSVNVFWDSEEDSRWVFILDVSGEKYVIKAASNDFTTIERVSGWRLIIQAYTEMGYYSPSLKKSLHGNYAESLMICDKHFVVWEEEYCRYSFFESLGKDICMWKDGKYVYHDQVMEFLGRIGQKHFDFFPYPSGWERLVPFGSTEKTDEIMSCVEKMNALVREKRPDMISRWEMILELFMENKRELEKWYPILPRSVFQADVQQNNLVLDEHGNFKGVIDYNLAGMEVVINRFLSDVLFGYSYYYKRSDRAEDIEILNDTTQDSILEIVRETLQKLRNYYEFSEIEAQAAPFLYKYISCIEYTHLEAFEKYQNDTGKITRLFDFMEKQLRREFSFEDVMLMSNKPEYLYHGSQYKLEEILPQRACGQEEKESLLAIYAAESMNEVIPFALPIRWYPDHPDGKRAFDALDGKTYLRYGSINPDGVGYVYKLKSDTFEKIDEWQWCSKEPAVPVEVIEIKVRDYMDTIEFSEETMQIQRELYGNC